MTETARNDTSEAVAGSPSTAVEVAASARDPNRVATYIARRIDPQIAWLEAKAADAKRKHFAFAGTQIAATSMIPVANLMPGGAVASTILAAIVAITTGLSALGAHHSNWLRYRATAMALQKVKLHHELGLAPFDGADADDALIHEIEGILGGEHDGWHAQARTQTAGKSSIPKTRKARKDDDD